MTQNSWRFQSTSRALLPVSVAGGVLFATPSLALPNCTIFSHQAEKGIAGSPIEVKVGSSGTNIIIPDEEVVTKAWLDDISQIGMDSDGVLCPSSSQMQQNCSNEGATVLHLKRIQLINFPNLLKNPDGSTLLTAISRSPSKRKVFAFRVIPTSGHSKCHNLTILPDPEPRSPLTSFDPVNNSSTFPVAEEIPGVENSSFEELQQTTNHSNSPKPTTPSVVQTTRNTSLAANSSLASSSVSQNPAIVVKDARQGLEIAKRIKLLEPLSKTWFQAREAIKFLETGNSISQAAQKSGLSEFFLSQLIYWGKSVSLDSVSSL